MLFVQYTVALVLSVTILEILGGLQGNTTTQPLVFVSRTEEYALDKVAEQFDFTLNKYPVHICRPVTVALLVLVLIAVHTLVALSGEVVYSSVKEEAPVVPATDQLMVALVLSAVIVPIVGVGQVTVTGQPLVFVSLNELYALERVFEQFVLTLNK